MPADVGVCIAEGIMGNSGVSLSSPQWLTVRQTAAQLGGVSTKLVYKLFHAGELPGAKIAGTVRIRAASVAAYLEAHSNRKAEPVDPVAATTAPSATLAPAPVKRRRKRQQSDHLRFRFFPRETLPAADEGLPHQKASANSACG